jgi:23S rRNA pseudouridine2605 synthase
MTDDLRPEPSEAGLDDAPATEIEDPIGDETDGEAETVIETETEAEIEAAEGAAGIEAEEEPETEAEAGEGEPEPEFNPKPRPPVKLERLQKILAQAGVASRRKAEELIEQGRVQVNGKVVTQLGTKADAGRDHIRVDGKLLQGAERLRYFVLNKPKGFVTTVKDPEGRPTVMQFFDKMRERLYPVGRLDYMSEGLLLVTNDGELANRLTRAASGVEKTYLVKVAGQPTEAELDVLRGGVSIERGKAGSGPVRTSPARIRQVRQGDNPWYEVVLIEGRNRELRKMFEEIGHFVEKIRRVGYGPLVLDQEPGNMRELEQQELEQLRKAADGTLRTPKSKEIRRRNMADSLPTVKPAFTPRAAKAAEGSKDYRPKRSFGADRPVRSGPRPAEFGSALPTGSPAARPAWKKDDRPSRPPTRFAPGSTGEAHPVAGRSHEGRQANRETYGARPGIGRPFGDKSAAGHRFPAKPGWKKPEAREWPPYKRPPAPRHEAARRQAPAPIEDLGQKRPSRLHIEPIPESEHTGRPEAERPGTSRPSTSIQGPGRSSASRSSRPFRGDGGRGEGGLSRPFTTSSGKPRAGGARPGSKPGKSDGRSYGSGPGTDRADPRTRPDSRPSYGAKRPYKGKSTGRSSAGPAVRAFRGKEGGEPFAPRPSRPYAPRADGASESRASSSERTRSEGSRAERKTGSGWKPKPSFGGPGKPASGARSKPKVGGFSKSGYKGKPSGSGAKRTGPQSSGKRGGAPGGKKRH